MPYFKTQSSQVQISSSQDVCMCFPLNWCFPNKQRDPNAIENLFFFRKVRHMLLFMVLQQFKMSCSKTANINC